MAPPVKIVDLASLQEETIKYQKDLRFFPYYVLSSALNSLGISLMQVENIDVIKYFERLAGLARPYVAGNDINYGKIGRVKESRLQVETCFAPLKEHILNYRKKRPINKPDVGLGTNKTKKHLLQNLFSGQAVITVTEDIMESIFPAERDLNDESPMGMLDGFDTIIDQKIAAAEIASGKGNIKSTGAISAPSDTNDTDAIDQLVAFVRGAHHLLRSRPALLMLSNTVLLAAADALENKKSNFRDAGIDEVQKYINTRAQSRVVIVTNPCLGSGDRITLTTPGNYDLGMNTFGDYNFVQVRSPFEDPNFIQFWIQWDLGARIRTVHEKMYQVNDGTPLANELAGDYESGSE